jgi:hypothetical protein
VKLKLKMGRKQLAVIGVVVLLLVGLLVARHKGRDDGSAQMDSAAARACTDFANGYPHAKSKASRLELADKVTHNSSQSSNRTIAARAAAMGHGAGDTDAKWRSSASALTDACRSAGWKA